MDMTQEWLELRNECLYIAKADPKSFIEYQQKAAYFLMKAEITEYLAKNRYKEARDRR